MKYIIAQCTMRCSIDQIRITAVDAIRWIDKAWKTVTDITIRNAFRVAGFFHISLDQHTTNDDAISADDHDHQNTIEELDDLLCHFRMNVDRMSLVELVNIHSDIPTLNEWNDNNDQLIDTVNADSPKDVNRRDTSKTT